jgi:hypothetical protein
MSVADATDVGNSAYVRRRHAGVAPSIVKDNLSLRLGFLPVKLIASWQDYEKTRVCMRSMFLIGSFTVC